MKTDLGDSSCSLGVLEGPYIVIQLPSTQSRARLKRKNGQNDENSIYNNEKHKRCATFNPNPGKLQYATLPTALKKFSTLHRFFRLPMAGVSPSGSYTLVEPPSKSSQTPNTPVNALRFLMALITRGKEARTKRARTEGQMMENLRCHFGSSTYELGRVMRYLGAEKGALTCTVGDRQG